MLDLHGFTTLGNLGIARAFSPPLWSPTWKPWLKADQLALRRTHPKSARNAMIWADAGFASEVGKDPTCKNCLVVGSWSSMCKYVVSCNQGISGVFMDQYPGLSDYPGLSENRVPKNPCSRSKLTFWEVNPPFSNRPIWSKRLPQNPQSACTLTKLMTMRYSPGAGLHGPILYEMVMVVANCGDSLQGGIGFQSAQKSPESIEQVWMNIAVLMCSCPEQIINKKSGNSGNHHLDSPWFHHWSCTIPGPDPRNLCPPRCWTQSALSKVPAPALSLGCPSDVSTCVHFFWGWFYTGSSRIGSWFNHPIWPGSGIPYLNI